MWASLQEPSLPHQSLENAHRESGLGLLCDQGIFGCHLACWWTCPLKWIKCLHSFPHSHRSNLHLSRHRFSICFRRCRWGWRIYKFGMPVSTVQKARSPRWSGFYLTGTSVYSFAQQRGSHRKDRKRRREGSNPIHPLFRMTPLVLDGLWTPSFCEFYQSVAFCYRRPEWLKFPSCCSHKSTLESAHILQQKVAVEFTLCASSLSSPGWARTHDTSPCPHEPVWGSSTALGFLHM